MEEQLMENRALLERRLHECLEALGKMKLDDNNYQKILNQVKIYSEILNADDNTEVNRLNNNAKNETEDRRVTIEAKKTKNETARIWLDLASIFIDFGSAIASPFMSYRMEEHMNSYKKMEVSIDKFRERVRRKRR